MKHRTVSAFLLASLVFFSLSLPISTASAFTSNYSSSDIEEFANIYNSEAWLKIRTKTNPKGCARWTEEYFKHAYDHGFNENKKVSKIFIRDALKGEDLYEAFLEYDVQLGDGVIINENNGKDTHRFILVDYTRNNFTVYESGYGLSKTNKVFKNAYTYEAWVKGLPVNNSSFTITIVQPNSNYVYNCSHKYEGAGICKYCGESFAYVFTKYSSSKAFRITVDNKPDHYDSPYGDAKIAKRYSYGEIVYIVGETANCYGNRWYKTDSNTWIYGGYLTECSSPMVANTDSRSTPEPTVIYENPPKAIQYQYTRYVYINGGKQYSTYSENYALNRGGYKEVKVFEYKLTPSKVYEGRQGYRAKDNTLWFYEVIV